MVGNQTYCDHFADCTNTELFCCTPETNTMLHTKSISISKERRKKSLAIEGIRIVLPLRGKASPSLGDLHRVLGPYWKQEAAPMGDSPQRTPATGPGTHVGQQRFLGRVGIQRHFGRSTLTPAGPSQPLPSSQCGKLFQLRK